MVHVSCTPPISRGCTVHHPPWCPLVHDGARCTVAARGDLSVVVGVVGRVLAVHLHTFRARRYCGRDGLPMSWFQMVPAANRRLIAASRALLLRPALLASASF